MTLATSTVAPGSGVRTTSNQVCGSRWVWSRVVTTVGLANDFGAAEDQVVPDVFAQLPARKVTVRVPPV